MSQQHTILVPGSVTVGQGKWISHFPAESLAPAPSRLRLAVEQFNEAFPGTQILLPVGHDVVMLMSDYATAFGRPDIAQALCEAFHEAQLNDE